ncbi:hypothetical protein [Lysinibacillus sphaericus]|uniref:hypothetical protein n=1 Tax=Lysinibacillus sphaericus TaxID=1421 RepID=UPI001CBC218C|nr:hypothetical protein [Lysinibacillus sphaericus]
MEIEKVQGLLEQYSGLDIDSFKEIIPELFGDITVGTLFQGVMAMKNTMKFKRFEKNYQRTITEMNEKIANITSKAELFEQKQSEFQSLYLPLIIENMANEVEVEKMRLFVNGFITSVTDEEIEQEKVLAYNDVLRKIRVSEIQHFYEVFVEGNYRVYYPQGEKITDEDVIGKDDGYHSYVRSKLVSLGIIFQSQLSWGYQIDKNFEITEFGKELIEYCKMNEIL